MFGPGGGNTCHEATTDSRFVEIRGHKLSTSDPYRICGINCNRISARNRHHERNTVSQIDSNSNASRAIFWAGFTCGVLDISAAFITWGFRGVKPYRILQGIASGLLGPRSFNGGWPTAVLGLACHFFIAFSADIVFYMASPKIMLLTRRAVVSGIVYGVLVYLIMYWVVVPLSRAYHRLFSPSATIIAIITHMVCVGLPIALMVRRYSR